MWVFNFKLKTMNSILILMTLTGVLVGAVLAYLVISYNSNQIQSYPKPKNKLNRLKKIKFFKLKKNLSN